MSYYNIYEEYGLKHYQLPKVFFTNEQYKKMNNDTKIAWSILRDRFSLSSKNGWFDEIGNIFFVFTNEELKEILGISEGKLYKVKKELIDNNLLEQKRMGLNSPNRLYLKKPIATETDIYQIENQEKDPAKPYYTPDTQKMRVKTLKKQVTGHSKNEGQDTQKMSTSNTDLNNTDLNNTESSNNHHHEGFTKKQSDLINRFAKENNLKNDDDDFIKLIGKLKEYKPNSMRYIAKAYKTVINEEKTPKVAKKTSNEVLPDWFKDKKHKQAAPKKEQKKSTDLTDQQKKVAERLKKYAAQN